MDPASRALLDAVRDVVGPWVERSVARRAGQAGMTDAPGLADEAAAAGRSACDQVCAELAALLDEDVDAQRTTPLAILRQAVSFPTAVLTRAGVPAVERDRFAEEAFPGDVYDLTPAKFSDIDPSLADPGVAWGAAKAMAHMQRHRRW